MRSPAAAIAWQFRQAHRVGFIGLVTYVLVLAATKLVVLTIGQPVRLDSPQSFAFVVVIPFTAAFTYFLAVFSYGMAGDLAARRSMYPARMLTLPVTTAALTAWPMLYGSSAMALLWVATKYFALWPTDMDVPVVWPAVLAAVLLAWTQTLTWMPYGLPGLRVIVAVLWLAAIDAAALLALHYRAHELEMVAILAPQFALAYLAARVAVARARRGHVPDWRGAFAWLARVGRPTAIGRGNFSAPVGAQTWFEWRRCGTSLPVWVAILLPFELSLLLLAGSVPVLVFTILLGVLLTPPIMAAFAAATVRTSNPRAGDSYGVTPFIATRPLTSAELVAAKLTASMWSTAAAWLLVLIAIPLALTLSGTAPVVMSQARWLVGAVGTSRAIVLVLLALSGLIVSTWKRLVQSLYVGLTGRVWLIKGSVFVILSLLFLIGPLIQLLVEHEALRASLWEALPGILAVLACVKLAAAGWIATRLHRRRLLSDRVLLAGAAAWCVVVLALFGVLAWFVDTPFLPRYVLVLLAILAIPLTRLSAAPLALAWNRHR